MKKRVISFLLAFCLLLTMFGDLRSLAAQTECPYCEYTLTEDGALVHADDCNTLFEADASADVGKTAAFSISYGEVLYVNEKPHAGLVYDTTSEEYSLLQTSYDINDPPLVEIVDWCWEVSGPTLWYRVEPLDGNTLPEGLTTESWILQRYTNEEDPLDTVHIVDGSVLGKTAKFNLSTVVLYENFEDAYYGENAMGVDPTSFGYMTVTDLYTDGVDTWYYVDAVDGAAWPEAYTGYHYVISTDISFVNLCEVCGKENCQQIHLYCLACEKFDCELTHQFCGYCNDYDCGIDHLEQNRPLEAPVIPDAPALSEEKEVTVVDGQGVEVLGGLKLGRGDKLSLSAWTDIDASADIAYQWQIRYDLEEDLWANIQGQTGKGILVSPAMVLSVLETEGAAAIRCVVTAGGETRTGDAIPMTVEGYASSGTSATGDPITLTVKYVYADGTSAGIDDTVINVNPPYHYLESINLTMLSGYQPVLVTNAYPDYVSIAGGKLNINFPEGVLTGDTVITVTYNKLSKYYVIVEFVYADGRTAASRVQADIIPGQDAVFEADVPAIPGYAGSLLTHSYGDAVKIEDGKVKVNIPAAQLTEEYEVFTVRYDVTFVPVTVIHYQQNVGNDNYTQFATETIDNVFKTNQQVVDVHNSYPGFYNLLYETPVAAADGSTVIEVYYDRYYYLMKFDLGENGYGVDPVYARYGDTLEVGTPTRAGYTFLGWDLAVTDTDGDGKPDAGDGVADTVPATVPADSQTYIALWQMADTAKVNVVIWGENADDEEYSYQKTIEINAKPGETISWETLTYSCGLTEHKHNSTCNVSCGYTEHIHSVDNGCYTLSCDEEYHNHEESGCATNCDHESHTHGVSCYDGAQNDFSSQANRRPQNPENGQVDEGKNGKYIYINGSWYDYEGSAEDGEIAPTNCGKTEGEATHDDSCYTCGKIASTHVHDDTCYILHCNQTEHTHTSSCYSCGYVEHTHTSDCEIDTDEYMDSDLWEFYESESVTVNPDGSTVLNVKYTRKQFTIDFYKDSDRTEADKVYTITAKWGENISEHWPIEGYDDGQRWEPYGSETYSAVLVFIEIMPAESFDLVLSDKDYDTFIMHYMVEVLPGETGTSYTYNGTTKKFKEQFQVEANYNYVTEDEDFFALDGYTQWTSNPKFSNGQLDINGGGDVYFYYTRNTYAIEFYNPTTLLKKETGIYYESNLGSYDFTPTAADAPEIYEPGSVQFAGWYLNPECTGDEYILADHTMPSATEDGATALVLYAKWEPVEYKVNYHLSKESLDRDENIPAELQRRVEAAVAAGAARPATDPYTEVFAEDIVKHGYFITDPPDPEVAEGYDVIIPGSDPEEYIHPYTGYDFEGWFYIDEDGEEAAFDPVNIPVTHDLKLYAKWSSNVLCKYNVYFALDANADGVADTGTDGNIIYVADPISGNGLAGRTYTFAAKGGSELYANYQTGYFPNAGSHSITIDVRDEEGTGANTHTFLYQPQATMPYTVRYLEKDTDKVLATEKYVDDNDKVVVTENFVTVSGYMPDEYQKTLVVSTNAEDNVITFYYTVDTENAPFVINYYIQELDADLNHAGWRKYDDTSRTGKIGTVYYGEAIDIDGFTLSAYYTDLYNVTQNKNGATGTDLPSQTLSALTADGKISGTLTANGMELNFYYTRNLYPYEFRYMLQGTATELADPEFGKAGYDMTVTEAYKTITMDLDNDGIYEDFQLYDPTEITKSIKIKMDGEALSATDVVEEGDANINIATFYYVRCTQTMTVTKTVVDKDTTDSLVPDSSEEFTFQLAIHAADGYHMGSYTAEIGGQQLTLTPDRATNKILTFKLKDGQTITINGLPTAQYTLTEVDIPTGYYPTASSQTTTLTKDARIDFAVTNEFDPAVLELTKTVNVVEDGNVPEVEDFEFYITVPSGVTGDFDYTVGGESYTATVTGGKLTLTLENGQTARFENVPIGSYTIEEKDYSDKGYKPTFVQGEVAPAVETNSVDVTVTRGSETEVTCLNQFPVGDLVIEKTVDKEFYGTAWDGDTFTFIVERTTTGRPLIAGNGYTVELDGVPLDAKVTVNAENRIVVTISFSKDDAALLDEESEKNKSVTHTLVIKNLPAGTYSVTENENAAYAQTPSNLVVDNLVIPANDDPKAVFTNELIRPTGDLSLTKTLVAATGYTGTLPQHTMFSFTFEATLQAPADGSVFTVVYSKAFTSEAGTTPPAVPTQVVMQNGKFTLQIQAGQTVEIENLPIDTYRITEATVPRMANKFYHNGNADPETITKDASGNLYTEIAVTDGGSATVRCENTYPVDHADLTIVHEGAESEQIFVYEVESATGEVITVTSVGSNSTTIHDLPFGTYTVTQINDWSWRYRDAAQTVKHQAAETTVTFSDTWLDKWLGGCSTVIKNIWGALMNGES